MKLSQPAASFVQYAMIPDAAAAAASTVLVALEYKLVGINSKQVVPVRVRSEYKDVKQDEERLCSSSNRGAAPADINTNSLYGAAKLTTKLR